MITLLHGDDTTASRNALHSYKERYKDVNTVYGSSVDVTSFAQLFESDNLFGTTEAIFFEDLISAKKQSSEFDVLLSYLKKHAATHTMYLWEGKEVTKTVVNKLGQPTVQLYKIPQSLFQFLDSISPKNTKGSLLLFHKAIATAEAELVFFMMIRHFRLLLALSGKEAEIEETQKMAPWQKSKIKRQSELFPKNQLKNCYQMLQRIDLSQKTGASALSLTASIDIFLMNL